MDGWSHCLDSVRRKHHLLFDNTISLYRWWFVCSHFWGRLICEPRQSLRRSRIEKLAELFNENQMSCQKFISISHTRTQHIVCRRGEAARVAPKQLFDIGHKYWVFLARASRVQERIEASVGGWMKTIKYELNEMAEMPFIFKLVLHKSAIINPLSFVRLVSWRKKRQKSNFLFMKRTRKGEGKKKKHFSKS